MRIALAQIQSLKGDVQENSELHKKAIRLSLANKADAIFFPELSLTGYEPILAEKLKMKLGDNRLLGFQEISNTEKVTIGLGMPLHTESGIEIAMIIFQPNIPLYIYTKQLLHEDEQPYFQAGNKYGHIQLSEQHIALAICYESLQSEHAHEAINHHADIYLASVAKSQSGIEKAYEHFKKLSKTHALTILMCNNIGPCDNFEGAGQSAVWKNGDLLGSLFPDKEGILIFDSTKQSTESFYF